MCKEKFEPWTGWSVEVLIEALGYVLIWPMACFLSSLETEIVKLHCTMSSNHSNKTNLICMSIKSRYHKGKILLNLNQKKIEGEVLNKSKWKNNNNNNNNDNNLNHPFFLPFFFSTNILFFFFPFLPFQVSTLKLASTLKRQKRTERDGGESVER